MLKILKYTLAASLLVGPVHVGAALAQVDLPGFDRLAVSAAHRPGLVAGSIWYPAGQVTYKTQVGRNAVFTGAPAYLAPGIAKGRHPLIVLSHGSGGNIDGLGWLAGALAQNGAMVLGVNHPGSTGGDSSPRRSIRMWERAWDVSAALDTVLAEPNFAPHIDPERVYSIGFSMGGATVLQLAGLRGDIGAFKAHCTGAGVRHLGCAYFAAGGVNYDNISAEDFNQDLREPRISRTVGVDPGLAMAYTDASIAALDHPMLLIALGHKGPDEIGIDAGPNGSNLSGRLQDTQFHELTPASHFSFLGMCTKDAVEILKAEGEDRLCHPEDTAIRASVHQKVIALISEFLRLNSCFKSLEIRSKLCVRGQAGPEHF